jgi:cation transport ATPase
MMDDLRPADAPLLVSVVVLGGRDESEFLALAGTLASMVNGPLGAAILASADRFEAETWSVDNFRLISPEGLSGLISHQNVILGSSALFTELGLSLKGLGRWTQRLVQQGQHVMFVAVDGETAGFIGIVNLSNGLIPRFEIHLVAKPETRWSQKI